MDPTGIDIGDVYVDEHDTLWRCVMATEQRVVLHSDMHEFNESPQSDWVMDKSLFMVLESLGKMRFMWSENSPGIIQTSKGRDVDGNKTV